MYLISACLCGVNCKYNGENNYNEECNKLFSEGKAILICPEQLGGLPTPRVPSEIQGEIDEVLLGKGKILTKDGRDVTAEFIKGAQEVGKIADKINITKAILKDGSPSCGVNYIYDGSFTGKKIKGMGTTAKVLANRNIEILSEKDLGE